YPWLFLLALAHTSATNTALLIALNPVFTLLLSPLIGEPLDRHRLGGVSLALAGAAVVITAGDTHRLPGLSLQRGDVLAVAAAGVALLRVGLAVSLTGPLAPMGSCARRGLELWADEARAARRAVELVVRDDRSAARTAREQVEDLLRRVDLLAGPYSSGLTR